MLQQYSSEEHPVSQSEMEQYLNDIDMSCEQVVFYKEGVKMIKLQEEKRSLSPEFIKRLDRLYRTLKSCDMRLINTSNELKQDVDRVLAAYLFSISSYGLSFINNIVYGNAHSIGNIYV